jgi:threonine/homoserine/homoserine lactone efflux protein
MSTQFPALVAFVFAAATTPGPTNVMVSASGANFGYRRTLPFIFGSIVGIAALAVTLGLGLGQLLKLYPAAHDVLKWAGSAYLLYLAWRVGTAGRPRDGGGGGRPLGLVEGLLFQWLNPKGWLAILSALAVFSRSQATYLADTLVVAGLFFAFLFLATTLWCLFGTAIARLLTSRRARTAFNAAMSLIIVASIALLYI